MHSDGPGSIRLITDASGAVTGETEYDAFGVVRSTTGVSYPFGYTGEQVDSETGFVYLRARYMDPATGRFLSQDPIGIAGGINLYAYVCGNPTNFIDPSGNMAMPTWVADGSLAHKLIQDEFLATQGNGLWKAEVTKKGTYTIRLDLYNASNNSFYEIKPATEGGRIDGASRIDYYIDCGLGLKAATGQFDPIRLPVGDGRWLRAWEDKAIPGLILYRFTSDRSHSGSTSPSWNWNIDWGVVAGGSAVGAGIAAAWSILMGGGGGNSMFDNR